MKKLVQSLITIIGCLMIISSLPSKAQDVTKTETKVIVKTVKEENGHKVVVITSKENTLGDSNTGKKKSNCNNPS